jgi:hypothetical protein
MLNAHYEAWRAGRGVERSLDFHSGVGSVEWMVETYRRSDAWDQVSERSRPEYIRTFNLVLKHKTRVGTEVGAAPLKTITTLGCDKLYKALKKGKRVEQCLTQANKCMLRMAKAWDHVRARYPNLFPQMASTPFELSN